MANLTRVLKMARNAYEAWKAHRADLSADAEAKATELAAKIAAYDIANGEHEAMKQALLTKTAEVNALGKAISDLRVDLAKLVDAKLSRSDLRRKLFRNDQ